PRLAERAHGAAVAMEDEIGEDGAVWPRDRSRLPTPLDDRSERGGKRNDTRLGVLRVLAGDGDQAARTIYIRPSESDHFVFALASEIGEARHIVERLG